MRPAWLDWIFRCGQWGRESAAAHLAALGALTVLMVAATWRGWPDPVVDFGRELYTAWRLSEGAVLYRDIDGFYGPLSQYLNGGLFRLFGPGLTVLVWSNLAVFAGIVLALYLLLRGGWRPMTALAATAVFILVFGFSRFSTTGSFNFAAPYAHEVTHGVLLLLLLAHVLVCWREKPKSWHAGVAGLLVGLMLLLKPEFVFAALAATGLALLERVWSSDPDLSGCRSSLRCPVDGGRRSLSAAGTAAAATEPVRHTQDPELVEGCLPPGSRRPLRRAEVLGWLAGLATPTLLAVVYFGQHFDLGGAVSAAGRGWLNAVATRDYVLDPAQLRYLGFDEPLTRLGQQGWATAMALLAIGALAGGAWVSGRLASVPARWGSRLVVVSASVAAAYAWRVTGWMEVGCCLLGLALVYLGWQVSGLFRERPGDEAGRRWARLMFGVVAVSLMARMLLNGRIYQFGFYQAALVGSLLVAVLLEDFPRLFRASRFASATAFAGVLGGLAVGVGLLVDQNLRTHSLLTEPMGSGRDRFLVLREEVLPANPLLAGVVDQLSGLPAGQTLVCLPEGLMVNYLARMRSPLSHFFYYSVVTETGRERQVVDRLRQEPPDWVLLLPRDLREYGIIRYGERSGAGADLLAWVRANYESVGQVRGEPMTYDRHDLQVFRRRR